MTTRRDFVFRSAAAGLAAAAPINVSQARKASTTTIVGTTGPDPIVEKPAPITLADLERQQSQAVRAVEVTDYAPGRYTGALTPSPPHADLNAKKAVVIHWRDNPCRFVFSHEASYCPIFELSNGAGMGNQLFEGNLGDAELFNSSGRKERNSSVDIVECGDERAWVRWNYLAVHKDDDNQPRLRATEDYFAYPNGLVLRRATYESLMPDDVVGYSTQPVELYGILPAGTHFKELVRRDAVHGDYNMMSIADVYGEERYDIFWDEEGGVRRNGDNETLAAINASRGVVLVIPYQERFLFAVLGDASGFPSNRNQFVDHSSPDAARAGGLGWGQGWWDHWPIGWLNSQANRREPGSPYASHFGSIGQFLVPENKRLRSFWEDYQECVKDMEFNRWTAKRVYYVLLGSAENWSEILRIGRRWLDKGAGCARPAFIADLTQ